MLVLRCTKKLLARLHPSDVEGDVRSSSRLGDWCANVFVIRRQHLVLAVNHATLLPVLLPLAPAKTLVKRLPAAIEEVLLAIGVDEKAVAAEVETMADCILATTNDRRVLGIVTDFGRLLEAFADGRPLLDVALHLARTPCSPLGMKYPRDVAQELLARPRLHLVPKS